MNSGKGTLITICLLIEHFENADSDFPKAKRMGVQLREIKRISLKKRYPKLSSVKKKKNCSLTASTP